MRFVEIYRLLQEGYKEAEKEFSEKSSSEEAKDIIQKYKDLVNKNQVTGPERNIDYWRKLGWEKFKDFVNKKSAQSTLSQVKRKKNVGRSITLEENDKWLIVVPIDKDASCFHGKDSDWCTTKPFETHFERYFYESKYTLIYFIRKEDLEKWAVVFQVKETLFGNKFVEANWFDKEDRRIDEYHFEQETGLNPIKYIEQSYGSKNIEIIKKARSDWYDEVNDLYQEIKKMTPRKNNSEIENRLFNVKSPRLTELYIGKVGESNYSKLFMKMAVNMKGAYLFRFLNADDSIRKSAIRKTPDIVFHIDKPSNDMIKLALSIQPKLIKNVTNPDKEMQLIAVKKDGRVLMDIDQPDREVQIEALKTANSVYTTDKITHKDDPEFMIIALDNSFYAERNLKFMLDNNYEVTKQMIETVLVTNNKNNLISIVPIIIQNKEKFDFDAVGIASKIYKEKMEDEE
jgi:hypothetical protein